MTILENFNALVEQAFQKALHATKPMSAEMTQLLALVIFAGWEIGGPVHDSHRKSAKARNPERD